MITERCSYQQVVTLGTANYKPSKNPLPEAFIKVVKPVFSYPTNTSFLKQCKNVANQNASKLFNSIVWLICLEEHFNSPTGASFAVSLAVCL